MARDAGTDRSSRNSRSQPAVKFRLSGVSALFALQPGECNGVHRRGLVLRSKDSKSVELAGRTMLEQAHHRLTIETEGTGFVDVTAPLADWLTAIGAVDGLLTVFLRHT